MDRTPYHLPFTRKHIPAWRCPSCEAGHLTLGTKSLLSEETAESAREHDQEAWEPDWTRYVFACVFRCNNSSCKKLVSCAGTGRAETVEYEDAEYGWVQSAEEHFTPQFFSPPLVLMDVPPTCPPTVVAHLFESFALYFADPGAAMNCARTALEAVVTGLGVKRFIVKKGKRTPLNLHQRILLLPSRFTELSDLLIAVKWLGNAGSHSGDASNSGDLRVTYDLLEHALNEIYTLKAKRLKAIAKKVIKRKGPAK